MQQTEKNKIRFKHNKRRNTAFLFEALIRSIALARIQKKTEQAQSISNILREHFSPSSVLGKELRLYNFLSEQKASDRTMAIRLVEKALEEYSFLSAKQIFEQQTDLLKEIKNNSVNIDSVFVPNYKNLATLYQLFHKLGTPEQRILLEDVVSSRLLKDRDEEKLEPISNLTLKLFLEKFNVAYRDNLLTEQKALLEKFILSFDEGGFIELKQFLNEEIGRLKEGCANLLKEETVKKDADLQDRAKKIQTLLEDFQKQELTINDITKIMKIQQLVRET
jgi:hypothetical protein